MQSKKFELGDRVITEFGNGILKEKCKDGEWVVVIMNVGSKRLNESEMGLY